MTKRAVESRGLAWTSIDPVADHAKLATTVPSTGVVNATSVAATAGITAGTTVAAGTTMAATGALSGASLAVTGGITAGTTIAATGALSGASLGVSGAITATTATIGGILLADGLVKRITTIVDASAGGTAEVTEIGTVPLGSILIGVLAKLDAAFNGDATTTLEVGVTGNIDKYIDGVDFNAGGVLGSTAFSVGGANNDQKVLEYAAADIPVIATWTNDAAASLGTVRVTLFYI